jgi:uncharacterized protein YkwD
MYTEEEQKIVNKLCKIRDDGMINALEWSKRFARVGVNLANIDPEKLKVKYEHPFKKYIR